MRRLQQRRAGALLRALGDVAAVGVPADQRWRQAPRACLCAAPHLQTSQILQIVQLVRFLQFVGAPARDPMLAVHPIFMSGSSFARYP